MEKLENYSPLTSGVPDETARTIDDFPTLGDPTNTERDTKILLIIFKTGNRLFANPWRECEAPQMGSCGGPAGFPSGHLMPSLLSGQKG